MSDRMRRINALETNSDAELLELARLVTQDRESLRKLPLAEFAEATAASMALGLRIESTAPDDPLRERILRALEQARAERDGE